MTAIHTLVIGAGQAGLAASRCLTARGIDHVVLDRGRVAERWRSERWDSLRLLTPNWMSRLPEWSYMGPDPNGYMTAAEVTAYLQAYAIASRAPVVEDSAVTRLAQADDGGFHVETSFTRWAATNVVIATGWCDQPAVPTVARRLGPTVMSVTATSYRNPSALPGGAVLVVGASATGVQLADELARSGRDVIIAVGRHTRLPRRYRGMDIFWWLDRIGSLDRTIDELPDPASAVREPSAQLVGRPDHSDVDLPALRARGVQLAGRLVAVDGDEVRFANDLGMTLAAADARMGRTLADIDAHIDAAGLATEVLEPEPRASVTVADAPLVVNLRRRGIGAVVWATGFRRSYPWLHLPILDEHGEIRQRLGVTPVEGVYVLGQRFQHRRRSNFLDGVGLDAELVADHLTNRTLARSHRCDPTTPTTTS
jgi:putative flavoprotein involved in K+ transport